MKRIISALVIVLAAALLAGCGGGSEPRSEPFVGQWESTGGERIAMTVGEPNNGAYEVNISGGGVDLTLTAKAAGEDFYEATPDTGSVWSFRLVDEDLLTATATPKGQAGVSTSFKRVGD